MLLAGPAIAALRMPETWRDEDAYRRNAATETPTESLLATMGYDNYGVRRRTARKLRRSGLDAFTLPCDSDVDKIVRFEGTVKRNLFRALDLLERIQAARTCPGASGSTSSPRP